MKRALVIDDHPITHPGAARGCCAIRAMPAPGVAPFGRGRGLQAIADDPGVSSKTVANTSSALT